MGRRPLPDALPRYILRDTGTDSVRGILLVNVCFLLLTVGDVAAVWALPLIGVAGAMIGRGVFGALAVAGLAYAPTGTGRRDWRRLVPVRRRLVLLRSLVHAGASVTWYLAWQLGMGLADSYAIAYAAPLLMALIAVPMLGERLGARRIAAILLGFVGMLVMLRPGGDLWTPLALLLLLGVCGMSVSRVLTRYLATTETAECLAFWLVALHVPVGIALLFVGFPLPSLNATAFAGLLVLGLCTGVAHWLHSRAASLAPIAALAPYEYTAMLWAVLLGYWIFAQVPSWGTIVGAAVVAAAGLDTLYREHRRSRDERSVVSNGPLLPGAPAVAQRNDQ
jgi:drug/metabolite transporter (DMT)-like permease